MPPVTLVPRWDIKGIWDSDNVGMDALTAGSISMPTPQWHNGKLWEQSKPIETAPYKASSLTFSEHQLSVNNATVAGMTLFAWEFFMTLAEEFHLYRTLPWLSPQVLLFAFVRYACLASITLSAYSIWHRVGVYTCVPLSCLSGLMVQLASVPVFVCRTKRIWRNDRRIFYLMMMMTTIHWMNSLAMIATSKNRILPDGSCVSDVKEQRIKTLVMIGLWIAFIVITLMLNTFKLWQYHKLSRAEASEGSEGSNNTKQLALSDDDLHGDGLQQLQTKDQRRRRGSGASSRWHCKEAVPFARKMAVNGMLYFIVPLLFWIVDFCAIVSRWLSHDVLAPLAAPLLCVVCQRMLLLEIRAIWGLDRKEADDLESLDSDGLSRDLPPNHGLEINLMSYVEDPSRRSWEGDYPAATSDSATDRSRPQQEPMSRERRDAFDNVCMPSSRQEQDQRAWHDRATSYPDLAAIVEERRRRLAPRAYTKAEILRAQDDADLSRLVELDDAHGCLRSSTNHATTPCKRRSNGNLSRDAQFPADSVLDVRAKPPSRKRSHTWVVSSPSPAAQRCRGASDEIRSVSLDNVKDGGKERTLTRVSTLGSSRTVSIVEQSMCEALSGTPTSASAAGAGVRKRAGSRSSAFVSLFQTPLSSRFRDSLPRTTSDERPQSIVSSLPKALCRNSATSTRYPSGYDSMMEMRPMQLAHDASPSDDPAAYWSTIQQISVPTQKRSRNPTPRELAATMSEEARALAVRMAGLETASHRQTGDPHDLHLPLASQ